MNRAKASELILKVRRIIDRQVTATFVAGSYRRGKEEVGDLDFIVVGANLRSLVDSLHPEKVLRCGSLIASIVYEGERIQFNVATTDCLGAALMHSTGSSEFNKKIRSLAKSRGLKLSQYGLKRADDDTVITSRDERDIFKALNLPYQPPEYRAFLGQQAPAVKDESNEALAKALYLIASAHRAENQEWKARAFARAAGEVKNWKDRVTKENAHAIPGVGDSIYFEICSILDYGTSKRLHI